MDIELKLFGILRGREAQDVLQLMVQGNYVADVRRALIKHAELNWNDISAAFLSGCAFASSELILRDAETLPADGKLAILPPVSGG